MQAEKIDELFAATLVGDYEADAPWEAVHALRRIGSREVFDRAAEWCQSTDSLVRARGLDVLAQLGKTAQHPTISFPEECYRVVSELAQTETDDRPLASAICALGHLDDPRAIPIITAFVRHPNPEIRYSVACALGSFPNDGRSAKALLTLTEDADEDVRDWATFGLGSLGDLDSPEIRDALARRLIDTYREAREEAMVGLGKRHDERVLPVLLKAMQEPAVSDCVIEAAYLMLGMETEPSGWSAGDYVAALRKQFNQPK